MTWSQKSQRLFQVSRTKHDSSVRWRYLHLRKYLLFVNSINQKGFRWRCINTFHPSPRILSTYLSLPIWSYVTHWYSPINPSIHQRAEVATPPRALGTLGLVAVLLSLRGSKARQAGRPDGWKQMEALDHSLDGDLRWFEPGGCWLQICLHFCVGRMDWGTRLRKLCKVPLNW